MKKINYILVVVLASICAWSFTSCKKESVSNPNNGVVNLDDGVFNPDKKFSKKFYDFGNGKRLAEAWTWNGELLAKIATINENFYDTLIYNDKNQLTKRMHVFPGTPDYTEFFYDDGKLSKIVYYEDDELIAEGIVTHDGNKISKIVETYYGSYEFETSSTMLSQLFFDPILKNTVEKQERKMMKQCAGKAVLTSTISYSWDKDNIKKLTYECPAVEIYETIEYAYDDKENPFYRNLDVSLPTTYTEKCGSKNNVTKYSRYEQGVYEEGRIYTYTYEDDFPVMYVDEEGHAYYLEYE